MWSYVEELSHAPRAVLFVSAPDHLPRVVRDILTAGGTRAMFASSEIPFSEGGAAAVDVNEPPHG